MSDDDDFALFDSDSEGEAKEAVEIAPSSASAAYWSTTATLEEIKPHVMVYDINLPNIVRNSTDMLWYIRKLMTSRLFCHNQTIVATTLPQTLSDLGEKVSNTHQHNSVNHRF